MATYVPNASDPTQPTEDKFVESAALEFRTLKGSVVRTVRFPLSDAAGNIADLPAAVNRAGRFLAFDSITGQPIPGPLLSAWTITQAQIAFIEATGANIADVTLVADNMASIIAAVAGLPDLADKVSKTSDTGSAVMPTGTTAQRDGTPANGYTRFNTSLFSLEVYNAAAAAWIPAGQGATGAVGNPAFYENDKLITGNYTIPSNKNAGSFGPMSIDTGVTVTVSIGATWSIV